MEHQTEHNETSQVSTAAQRTRNLRTDCTNIIKNLMTQDLPEVKNKMVELKIELNSVINHLAALLKQPLDENKRCYQYKFDEEMKAFLPDELVEFEKNIDEVFRLKSSWSRENQRKLQKVVENLITFTGFLECKLQSLKKTIASIGDKARQITRLEEEVCSETAVLSLFLSDPDDERLTFTDTVVKAEKSESLKVLAKNIFQDYNGNHHEYQQNVEAYNNVQEEYIEILKMEVEEKKQKKRNLIENSLILPY